MTESDDGRPDEWTERIRKEIAPADDVRGRIVSELRASGLLAPERGAAARPWLRIAAGVILFAAGWVAGARWTGGPPSPGAERYAFLIYGETSDAAGVDGRAAEYAAWAREARARGRQISGERLEPDATVLGDPPSDARLGGFFIVEAATSEEARAIAAGHPHARYGGTIVIRRIARN